MSSSSSAAAQQNESQQASRSPTNEPSVSSQPVINHSVISSPTVPVLPGHILTQSDHEDELINNIDDMVTI